MTEKKLQYFITTAECENISQAAAKLFIAQPALSKIISGIEEELGYHLFDRIGKRVVLNQNGELFYQYAKKITGEFDSMRDALSELNYQQIRSLCVGVCVSSQLLPNLLQEFRKSCMNGSEQIQMKASYPLDFMKDSIDVIISSDYERKEEAGKEYLLQERILLAIPAGHPLEKVSKIRLEDTLEYSYVLPSDNTCLGGIIRQFLAEHSISYPANATTTNNSYVQCEMVARGLGISLVPEKSWVYAKQLEQIILKPLEDGKLERNIFFQYHPTKYRSEIMKKFGVFLKRYYATLQGNLASFFVL